MAKLFVTISDVKRIIFLIHRQTVLKLRIKSYDFTNQEHIPKLMELESLLNSIDSELKRFHDDDISNIERIMMEGYTDSEISGMYRSHMSRQKRKLNKWNK